MKLEEVGWNARNSAYVAKSGRRFVLHRYDAPGGFVYDAIESTPRADMDAISISEFELALWLIGASPGKPTWRDKLYEGKVDR